jgi:glycoside/pentoside/hexuronide:cation symporter, GPH family
VEISSAPKAIGSDMQLQTRELFAFGFLSMPLAMGGLPLALYVTPYYGGELGLSLSMIGIVLMLTRVTDVIIDPFIGALSDRTPARYGRRGLWIALGLPVMAISTLAVFAPFAQPTPLYLFFAIAWLYFGWTLINIPVSAWAAEISADYNERSRITGARTWASNIGLLLTVLLPLGLSWLAKSGVHWAVPDAPGSMQPMLRIIAWATVVVLAVSVVWMLAVVPQAKFVQSHPIEIRKALMLVAKNRPFMRLLASNVIGSIGWNCINTLFVFFVTDYLLADSSQWPLILLTYFAGQVVGTPIYVRIAPRFSKHRLLAWSSICGLTIFSIVLLLKPGQFLGYIILNFFTGVLAPAGSILSPSMAADVIDQDTVETEQQRGALFMALWAMGDKLAIAAASGIALPLVQFFGFDPKTPTDPDGLRALQYAFCLIPIVLMFVSIVFIWNFPLDRKRQEALRQSIADKGLRLADT